jgi:serine protease Do
MKKVMGFIAQGGMRMKWLKYSVISCLASVSCLVILSGCSFNVPNSLGPIQVASSITATVPSQNTALQTLPSLADIISSVEPSVVSVNTETVTGRRFVQRTVQGAGSGWIIDASGIIVTNNHVIEGAKTISIQINNGKSYIPTVVKADPASDLAILKINAGKLPALKVGDSSKLRVGDWVIAIGNPLGMGISAKNGIVSRLGVNIQASSTDTYSNLIETNAAINPGNSGGPLVNMSGEVIGITSLKLSTAGVEGMGYAININDAMPVIQKLSK